MFTPQKKLWSLTPRSEPGQKNGSGPGSGLNTNSMSARNGEPSSKGKALAFVRGDGIMDQESLTERVSKLENELFEYQYNMGLLLIEKKEWIAKYEELKQDIAEATDSLKREQTAHSSAMLELEKREENLKKALGVERQCVLDLEKSIREMRSEHAGIKFNADSKLAEANALVTSVEEKSLEVEAKFHAADAKLAEVSRKSSEIERKIHELEAQENALRRERAYFSKECETHGTTISKQQEDLREWEHKLQEAEERLADGRRLLNEREKRANEIDNSLKEKQNNLAELRNKIEIANSTLKSKEDDIRSRLASVALKEKEADDIRKGLEDKEKQLLELEEKLNHREKFEIQKLSDEHQIILAEKQKEFELEMERKRQLNDEELKNKVVEVEKKEAEIRHLEEKVTKREQAVEKKFEKVREKEMDIDSKSKALKEREKSLKVEIQNMESDRRNLLDEKENLLSLKASLENLKTDNEKLQLRLVEDRERLKVTEDEREDFARLQSELKQEIDRYRLQSDQLIKQADDLKQEKEKFEKEWEELDVKRIEIKKEQEEVLEQNRNLQRLRQSEEERLHNQRLETEQYVQRELESLRLEKDSFAASMEHERSTFDEKFQSEISKLSHDFEMQKQELMTRMQKQQEELEASLDERVKSFEEERERENSNINYLREVARREMEEMKLERLRMDKEKMEISQNNKHVEAQQSEIKKDIDELVSVSRKLKDQREQFIKERERFIVFVEKQKNCNICGEIIREFILSDLHTLAELENLEAPLLPPAAENYLKGAVEGTVERFGTESSPGLVNSGSPISWLRKCTSKIFKFSPGKKLELDNSWDHVEASTLSTKQVAEPEPSFQVVNDSVDVEIVESDNATLEAVQALSIDQDPLKIPENNDLKVRHGKGGRPKGRRTQSGKDVLTGSKTNGDVENSVYTNDESGADSDHIGATKTKRKRNHVELSQATASDNQTEGHSESIKDGDRPTRRQRVTTEQSLGQKRYNLRQTKRSVGTVANGSIAQIRKGKEKKSDQLPALEAQSENVDIGRASREEINKSEAAAQISRRSEGRDGGDEAVRSTGPASEFSADSPLISAGGTNGANVDPADTYIDDIVLSEEVNGEMEYSDEEPKTESEGEDDNDNDEELPHPGEVSIGKKLWTFLTT